MSWLGQTVCVFFFSRVRVPERGEDRIGDGVVDFGGSLRPPLAGLLFVLGGVQVLLS